ncbi:MAG: chemotaxis protein, partial [Leptospiraceae bacterium]|nr:chemotaxis protein [Leptospiraceae bacterium]
MSELISVKLKSEAIKADRFLLLLLIIHFPFAAFIVPYGYGTMWIGIISGGVTVLLALLGYAFLRGTVLLQILNAILLMTYSAIFVTCQLGSIEMYF